MNYLPLLIGIVLPLVVGVFATRTGLDRDRAFYPTIMIVIAALYVLFAAMGGSGRALVIDSMVGLVFIAAATAGFARSLWIVVAALAGHGILDSFHGAVISNPGVPSWWPAFCAAYDLVAAAYLAWLLKRGHIRVTPANP